MHLNSKWRRAARMWGLQLEYQNALGKTVTTGLDTLQETLSVLAGQTVTEQNLDMVIETAREKKILRMLEPCYVQKRPGWISVSVFFPEGLQQKEVRFGVRTENGELQKVDATFAVGGKRYPTSQGVYQRAIISVRKDLAAGYYTFEFLKNNETVAKTLLLVPPTKKAARAKKTWGLFAPVYALHSQDSWGVGDLRDFTVVQQKVHEWGGDFVGTLPLLASPLDKKDLPYSPYSPVSKLFWNELFLSLPQLLKEETYQEFATRAAELEEAIAHVKKTELISYQPVYTLKKRLLKDLALHFFKNPVPEEYVNYVQQNPLVEDYAKFRAQGNPEDRKYHLFVQYQMHRQLGDMKRMVDKGQAAGLYIDFPVGTYPEGFDNQYFKSVFLNGCSVGAPPDLLFKDGQNWGFAPPNALALREQHYDYFIKSLRNHMQFAKILRIDHVMALKRLYIIPPGRSADKGIYLRYNADEFFTILAIEADRHNVQVIGENLGTVPQAVQEAIAQHDFYGMWVFAFEAGQAPSAAIAKAPPKNLLCLNTHDMSPFAGYLAAKDLDSFVEIGILDSKDAANEKRQRQETLQLWQKDLKEKDFTQFFGEITSQMALSAGEILLVNIEDLWAETAAQNVPGTLMEHPNWRRRLKYSVEAWAQDPNVATLFKGLTALRKKGNENVSTNIGRSVSI